MTENRRRGNFLIVRQFKSDGLPRTLGNRVVVIIRPGLKGNRTIDRMVFSDNDETWLLAYHQLILFILVAGRAVMPLPQDIEDDPSGKEILRDEKTQLIVGCIGSAADIIEFVSETVPDQAEQSCNSKLHLILWLCWSLRRG